MSAGKLLPRSLLIALVVATLIHALLILGLRFELPRAGQSGRKAITMTLVPPAAPATAPLAAADHPTETAPPAATPEAAIRDPAPPAPQPPEFARSEPPPKPTPAAAPKIPSPAARDQPTAPGPDRPASSAAIFVGPPTPAPGTTFIGPPTPGPRVLKEARKKLAASAPPPLAVAPPEHRKPPTAPAAPSAAEPTRKPPTPAVANRMPAKEEDEESEPDRDEPEDADEDTDNEPEAMTPAPVAAPSPVRPAPPRAPPKRVVESSAPMPAGQKPTPVEPGLTAATRSTATPGTPDALLPPTRQPAATPPPPNSPKTAPARPEPVRKPESLLAPRPRADAPPPPSRTLDTPPPAGRERPSPGQPVVGADKAVRQRGKGGTGTSAARAGQPRPLDFSAALLGQQIAEVSADLNRQRNAGLEGKNVVYASAMKTHRLVIAAYEQAWQEKVERIGNLNYPDEARRDKLSGGLLLAVGIKPDGSVYSVQIQRSSGHAVLDNAARHIIELAAPFAPLPEEIRGEVDILIITRTWRFDSNYHLETRDR